MYRNTPAICLQALDGDAALPNGLAHVASPQSVSSACSSQPGSMHCNGALSPVQAKDLRQPRSSTGAASGLLNGRRRPAKSISLSAFDAGDVASSMPYTFSTRSEDGERRWGVFCAYAPQLIFLGISEPCTWWLPFVRCVAACLRAGPKLSPLAKLAVACAASSSELGQVMWAWACRTAMQLG